MDDFGVLTEQFGLKPQGKSTPMAASRRSTPAQSKTTSSSIPSSFNPNPNPNSAYASFLDNQNSFDFLGGGATAPAVNTKVSAFDLDSVFSGSSSAKTASFGDGFDLFGNNGHVGGSGVKDGDFFGSFASAAKAPKKNGVAGNDLLGDLGGVRRKLQSMNVNGSGSGNRNGNVSTRNGGVSDDFLSGFGVSSYSGSSTQESRTQRSTVSSSQSNFSSPMVDPFLVLEESVSSSTPADSVDYLAGLEQFSKMSNSQAAKQGGSLNSSIKFKAPPKPAQVSNDIDDFEMFASAPVPKTAPRVPPRNEGVGSSASKHGKTSGDDLDFMFGTSFRSSSVPKSRDINPDPIFDAKADNRGGPRPPRTSSGVSGSMKKSSSESGMFDDLFSMDGGSSVVVEFEEVEGESEERRTARLARYQRTKARTLQAVADMNQRDFRTQQEQEERRRIAETMDTKIKSWAAGKEGNMRALLSSLQYVLWPECGWEPVSLTDLITSGSVKKVYRKATLCVHPDKVQQKGASLQQKYTAEKVFDVLKEAWTKFNKEELS